MHRSFLPGLVAAIVFSLPAQAEILTLTHGEVQIRDIRGGDTASKDIDTVLLGNSAVVEVTPVSSGRIALTAKALGTTSMILLDSNRNIIANDTIVVSYPTEGRMEVTVRTFGARHTTHSYACLGMVGCRLNRVVSEQGSSLPPPSLAETIAGVRAVAAAREGSSATPPNVQTFPPAPSN